MRRIKASVLLKPELQDMERIEIAIQTKSWDESMVSRPQERKRSASPAAHHSDSHGSLSLDLFNPEEEED